MITKDKIKSFIRNFDIDIVITTKGGSTQLLKCVTFISKNNPLPHQIIVVDNNDEFSEELFQQIKTICSKKNLHLKYLFKTKIGLSRARNLCLSQVDAPYYAFIDQDEYVHSKWISKLINFLNLHKDVDVVTGVKKSTDPNNYWNMIWDEIYRPGLTFQGPVDFASSSNTCYRTKFIRKNHITYDDSFTKSSEDRVFSYRLTQAHAKICFSAKIWLYHDFRNTFKSFIHQWLEYGKSMFTYHHKYLDKSLHKQFKYYISSLHPTRLDTPLTLLPGFLLLNLTYSFGYLKGSLLQLRDNIIFKLTQVFVPTKST